MLPVAGLRGPGDPGPAPGRWSSVRPGAEGWGEASRQIAAPSSHPSQGQRTPRQHEREAARAQKHAFSDVEPTPLPETHTQSVQQQPLPSGKRVWILPANTQLAGCLGNPYHLAPRAPGCVTWTARTSKNKLAPSEISHPDVGRPQTRVQKHPRDKQKKPQAPATAPTDGLQSPKPMHSTHGRSPCSEPGDATSHTRRTRHFPENKRSESTNRGSERWEVGDDGINLNVRQTPSSQAPAPGRPRAHLHVARAMSPSRPRGRRSAGPAGHLESPAQSPNAHDDPLPRTRGLHPQRPARTSHTRLPLSS